MWGGPDPPKKARGACPGGLWAPRPVQGIMVIAGGWRRQGRGSWLGAVLPPQLRVAPPRQRGMRQRCPQGGCVPSWVLGWFRQGASHSALLQRGVVGGVPKPAGTRRHQPLGPTAPPPSPVPRRVPEHPGVPQGGVSSSPFRPHFLRAVCPPQHPNPSWRCRLPPKAPRGSGSSLGGEGTPKPLCSGDLRPRDGKGRPSSSAGPRSLG